jgi:hypothetical protein
MSVETAPAPTSYEEWRDRRWRVTSLLFVVLWLVTAAAVGLAGEKRSDLGSLQAGIADGSVSRVEVVGLPEGAQPSGRTSATLEWRDGWFGRFAEVTVDARRDAPDSLAADEIHGDPATFLRAGDPELEIGYRAQRGGHQEWRGWRGPQWGAWLGLATWIGTVLLAGNGPEPWRATKWAWTWLTLLGGPLGCLGFFLLGGPLGLWRPRDPDRRLNGVWAFILSVVLFGGSNAG